MLGLIYCASVVQWLARLTTNPLAQVRFQTMVVGAQFIQLFILPNWYLGKPEDDKLWKLGCYCGPVSRGNGFISTTGSKADVAEDERP